MARQIHFRPPWAASRKPRGSQVLPVVCAAPGAKKGPAQGGPKGRLPEKRFSSLQRNADHKLKVLKNWCDSYVLCKFFVSLGRGRAGWAASHGSPYAWRRSSASMLFDLLQPATKRPAATRRGWLPAYEEIDCAPLPGMPGGTQNVPLGWVALSGGDPVGCAPWAVACSEGLAAPSA